MVANWIINKRVNIKKVSPKKLAEMVSRDAKKKVLPAKELSEIIKKVFQENKKAVGDYKKGKEGVIEFLLGQVMRETKGAADPTEARRTLFERLKFF